MSPRGANGPLRQRRSWGRSAKTTAPTAAPGISPHDGRSKAYRWAKTASGICDRYQLLVFALALWKVGSILKERMFGLSATKVHGEDVKETGSISTALPRTATCACCTIPAARIPYAELIERNKRDRPGPSTNSSTPAFRR